MGTVKRLSGEQDKTVLPLSNAQIATQLEEVADLLEAQGANPFRVQAYRTAARTLRGLKRQVHEILSSEGVEKLLHFEGIGHGLAAAIEQLTNTGRLRLLERLRGEPAEHLIATVPTIGLELAKQIHDTLGIESLDELAAAARDGRLAEVPGIGRKRVRAVSESLAGRLHSGPPARETTRRHQPSEQPTVSELLDVDAEYRQKVHDNVLPRIAPRRFNPTGAAWLPVLHTQRGDRHYTALFSNTARAHELGTTHDWVVIYRDDHTGDGQWTIITSQYGELRGKRIVRGREVECLATYGQNAIGAQTQSCEASKQLQLELK